jgi:DNA-binding transcriptional MerR regulator
MDRARRTEELRSGELARRAGVSADTLRVYERRGLLAAPRRSSNGYRLYPPQALARVLLIQRALAAGFTLAELAAFLRGRDGGLPPCREVRARAQERLRDVDLQIEALTRFRKLLEETLEEWDRRLARTGTETPARLLDSLPATGPLAAHALKGLRFSRRARKGEKA